MQILSLSGKAFLGTGKETELLKKKKRKKTRNKICFSPYSIYQGRGKAFFMAHCSPPSVSWCIHDSQRFLVLVVSVFHRKAISPAEKAEGNTTPKLFNAAVTLAWTSLAICQVALFE